MADKVLLAESDVTVHVLFAPNAEPEVDQFGRSLFAVSSRVLRAGDTVDADMVPPYVLEGVKAGGSALKLMSKSEAEKLLAKAAELRALATSPEHMYAAGWDNSHSDHLVPDSIRIANLANEGGEPDTGNPSGVAPPEASEASAPEVADNVAEAHEVAADPSAGTEDLAALAVGEGSEEASDKK